MKTKTFFFLLNYNPNTNKRTENEKAEIEKF